MKEYKVIEANRKQAERIMNEMAMQGWEVVSVVYWNNFIACLVITFSKDK